MLSKLSWAGGHKPDIGLEEMTYKNKQLDILIIKNCTCTPIYLEEEYSPKGSNKKLLPCAIYARTDDRNTPINSSASMDMVEKLWKKRFHILEGVVDRIFNLLDDRPSDWKYSGTEEGTEYYYYKYDAAYNLKIEGVRNKDDGQIIIANPFTAFYGYTQFTPDVQCYKLNLYYSNQIPLVDGGYRIDVLDGERGIFPTPEIDSFNSHDPDFKKCLYAYYIIGSAKERLLRFLNRKRGQDQEFSYKKLERTVLFFESENQKKCFLEYYCVKHKEDIKNRFKRIKDSGSLVRTARSECNPELWNECSDNVCFSAALKEILEDFKINLIRQIEVGHLIFHTFAYGKTGE